VAQSGPTIIFTKRVHQPILRQHDGMFPSTRHTAHADAPHRLDALGRGLILRVAMAEKPVLALPPREELSVLTNRMIHFLTRGVYALPQTR
jgi:hypothetical protein